MLRSTSEYQLPFEPKEQNISSKKCNICTFLKNLSSGKLKWTNQEFLFSSKTRFLTLKKKKKSLWKKFLIASNIAVIFLKFLILYFFTNETTQFHSFLSYRPIILIWQFHLKGVYVDESLAKMISPEPSLPHVTGRSREK